MLIPLYEKFEQAYQVINEFYYAQLMLSNKDIVTLENAYAITLKEKFGVPNDQAHLLLRFAASLRPTYLQLSKLYTEAVAENYTFLAEVLKKKLLKMERLQEELLPSAETSAGSNLEKLVLQSITNLGAEINGKIHKKTDHPQIPLHTAQMLATFILDRIKPKHLAGTVRGVVAVHFSAFMHLKNMRINEQGQIITDTLVLTPTLATEIGGAEHEAHAVLRRAEGI